MARKKLKLYKVDVFDLYLRTIEVVAYNKSQARDLVEKGETLDGSLIQGPYPVDTGAWLPIKMVDIKEVKKDKKEGDNLDWLAEYEKEQVKRLYPKEGDE